MPLNSTQKLNFRVELTLERQPETQLKAVQVIFRVMKVLDAKF